MPFLYLFQTRTSRIFLPPDQTLEYMRLHVSKAHTDLLMTGITDTLGNLMHVLASSGAIDRVPANPDLWVRTWAIIDTFLPAFRKVGACSE